MNLRKQRELHSVDALTLDASLGFESLVECRLDVTDFVRRIVVRENLRVIQIFRQVPSFVESHCVAEVVVLAAETGNHFRARSVFAPFMAPETVGILTRDRRPIPVKFRP